MRASSPSIPPDDRLPRRGMAMAAGRALLMACSLLAAALPAGALEQSSTRTETLRWDSSGERVLRVCNIRGSVIARGVPGETGRLVVHESYRGPTAESVAHAREVRSLSVDRRDGVIEVSVGGPCDAERWGHNRDDDRWEATHEIELEVPHGVRAELRTVNAGEVRLSGHRGRFRAANVNGGVSVEEVIGAGDAASVNGPVRVTFAENPREACRFDNVNGVVDVAFRDGLAASFSFQTLNGEIYTDFPFEMAPLVETVRRGDRHKGRYTLRKRWNTAIEIGGGGPEHSVRTVNGDITIRND